ncbi:MAG: aminotransferase class III-fold pyridoxal phosphate-dependent enzyme [Deltaproteobacteria bacterium]|nr:aminotransferase class III-fold pyridoxal phosphate-dependent enzyme [Deltaproteobacteria bacterium]
MVHGRRRDLDVLVLERERDDMNTEEMISLCKKHTIYTWAKGQAVTPLPIERAEGVWMYTPEGERLLDFNSQLMSVNIGHGHPKVIEAMKRQLEELPYIYPGAATEIRARVGEMLADLVPGDINKFFFTLGGAEANENAIKIARQFTGKHKILSRYRSYHGATHATMQLTGDPRRWPTEPGAPGFIRVLDPEPYDYSFGNTDAEKTGNNLRYLEEIIMYEGGGNIAAMFIETVTGTNGILPPPAGYLQGLRKLLSKHEILLICDEVMCGFGRTGKMFAFEHGDILPDILTCAKGLTSSYAPLGAVGVRDYIADYFDINVFSGGLTYNSHPLGLAAAEAAVEVLVEEELVENAAKLEKVMRSEMDRLREKHPSVKGGRCIGLFGMIDLQKNSDGESFARYNGQSPVMNQLAAFLKENGLFTLMRWGSFMCNPPLCITERQLLEGFRIIDRGLDITDDHFER